MPKIIKNEEPNIIYSSDGSHKKKKTIKYDQVNPTELTIELKREKAKRGGKFVIVLSNLPNNPDYNKQLCKKLKKQCACGGTFKKGTIEVQGDKLEQVVECLTLEGLKSKKIGG